MKVSFDARRVRRRPASVGRVFVGLLRAARRHLPRWLPLVHGVHPLQMWETLAHRGLGRLNLTWVTPSLAVGGRYETTDVPRLARMGVTAVVDLREEERDDEEELARQGIRFLHLPTPDNHPLTLADLIRGTAWVQRELEAGGRVFIHCQHGVGRSVLLACAALLCDDCGPTEALEIVRSRRWQANPGASQLEALHAFGRHREGPDRKAV